MMANSERGYETRADNLQGFDLSMNMDSIDEPSRLPLLVVVALVVLAAFAGVVWLAYTQGVERGRASVSRELIAREVWKIRKTTNVPPYTGLTIYEQAGVGDRRSNLTGSPKRTAANAVPALRPSAGAAPDNTLGGSSKLRAKAVPSAPPLPTAASPQAKTAALQSAKVAATPQPQMVATRGPTELSKPAPSPPMPTHPITSPDSPPAPTVAQQQAAKPTPTPVPAELKGVVLQIGSYESEAEARLSWIAFEAEHDAAVGYQAYVKSVNLGAKGRWYRLSIGPFADKKSAMEVCGKLKADGASCLLAR
jgi:cell division septation protein DedD